MKKYTIFIIVLLAGVLLFKVAFDETEEHTQKSVERKKAKGSSPHTEKKPDKPLQRREPSGVATANTMQTQETKKEIEVEIPATVKPKRKLLGGADVEWIEESEKDKGYGKFGPPPM